MAKKMLIDATHAEECRVVVVDGTRVDEFDFESVNKRQLAGNIYLAKVTRVEPSLQAAFVDYGGNRHGFLAFSEVHPDYYQIPVADREALLAEERAYAASLEEEDEKPAKAKSSSRSRSRSRSRSKPKAAEAKNGDAVETREVSEAIPGMDVVDLGDDSDEALPLTGDAAMADAPEAEQASPPQPSAEQAAEEPSDTTAKGDDSDAGDDEDNGDDSEDDRSDASDRDSDIESVADEDVSEEIRQPRKPRPKRYKIQEVIKVRQILLVQVVKEERGNKGAALTTYLSLAGRYCVLMPNTARGGGISRKITNAADRKKLKEIAGEIEVPEGAGLIIRTAGANRTKSEIKRDYEYLQRLWEQIRELTLKSVAPAPIYEEGNLIKRTIRDLYSREIDEVLVEGEAGYRVAKDFMKMIMPSHAKNVKHYTDPMPLFARYQVESYLSSMFNPTVQLKSGGYIVIGITEALVAVDVNSGRATKEGSIEETALKTNLEAAEEVARQMRLRDLAGLIVIDFIDMEERKNNAAVEKKLKDKLKTDRARIQVGRISGFGLLEMSRQRLRPGMLEATTQPCPACHGTGLIRSDDNLALSILRQLEEEGVRGRSKEVLLKAPVGIVNYLMNQKREHIAQIEARYGIAVRVEADPFLISPDFSIERFKTATRHVAEVATQAISIDMSDMPEAEEPEQEPEVESVAEEASPEEATTEETQAPKKRRRRRRRKKSGSSNGDQQNGDQQNGDQAVTGEAQAETPVAAPEAPAQIEEMTPAAPEAITEETPTEAEIAAPVQAEAEEAQPVPVAEEPQPQAMPEPAPEVEPEPVAEAEPAPQAEAEPEPVATAPEPEPEPELTADAPEEDDKPKKRGWWSLRS
ncbi:MAG: Rne/Rng family ribonuclease [Pseudomonadota bacterium]|nr:Rne/Rng family ribonuclease [Pseudomonadota bacterium]